MQTKNRSASPAKRNNNALCKKGDVRERKSFKLKHTFKLNLRRRGVRSVNVSSDNRYLIITFEGGEGRICVLDLKKLEFLPHEYSGHTDSVRLTSITNDNRAFYTASWDGTSRRFEINSGECTQVFSGFGRSPSCFLEPNQKYLFTASYDSDHDLSMKNAGRCWQLSSGKTIHIYEHIKERLFPESIDIAYEEGIVYTGSDDGVACKWKLKGKKPILKYFNCDATVRKVAVSPNYFAAACTDGYVRVHNKFSGEYFEYFYHGETDVRDVRISKDETKLWSAAEDGSVACFSLVRCESIYHKRPHSSWIWSMCLMNNDKMLVCGSGDGSVAFVSADSGQTLATLLNLPCNNDFLIACPPGKIFPTGFFYTTNRDLVQVVSEDRKGGTQKKLNLDDPIRETYINKLNLKNLVLTRLRSERHYDSMIEQYIQNQKILCDVSNPMLPRSLRA